MGNLKFHLTILSLLVFSPNVFPLGSEEDVPQLTAYLEEKINETLNYVYPSDYSDLVKTSSNETADYGTYDFIIVGSGPGGSVVANRLSEIEGWKVLLLEAGSDDSDFNKVLPIYGYQSVSEQDWGYFTTPQNNACGATLNRRCPEHAGKVIGGGSTINGALYLRGHKGDFQRWVDIYNATGWSYEEVLPYYKKSENATYQYRDEAYHGEDGYVTISTVTDTPDLTETLLNAYYELNYTYKDFNGGHSSKGVSRIPLALKQNERVSASTAFLKPFLDRKNLEISLNSFVTKVLISKDNNDLTAIGVEFVKNQTKYVAKARQEIIISAGPWSSAPVLLHSGIGPKADLEALGIPVVADLPVGQNFQDHPYYGGLIIRTNQTLYNYSFEENVERYVNNLRPLISIAEILAWSDLGENGTYARPNMEMMFVAPASSGGKRLWNLNDTYLAQMNADSVTDLSTILAVFHPRSRGTIKLQSKDPKDPPLIDPNLYGEQQDVDNMVQLLTTMFSLNNTSTFRNFQAIVDIFDIPDCTQEKFSREWLVCSIKYWGTTGFHGVAANSMGTDITKSVVNPRLQVHGIKNLRVADSSIFPETLSGHPHGSVYMIGERASDFIKEDCGKLN